MGGNTATVLWPGGWVCISLATVLLFAAQTGLGEEWEFFPRPKKLSLSLVLTLSLTLLAQGQTVSMTTLKT